MIFWFIYHIEYDNNANSFHVVKMLRRLFRRQCILFFISIFCYYTHYNVNIFLSQFIVFLFGMMMYLLEKFFFSILVKYEQQRNRLSSHILCSGNLEAIFYLTSTSKAYIFIVIIIFAEWKQKLD